MESLTIQKLPPDVAGKIAAGEVVERPESAVKELVENAIDAGATDIRIEIRAGGKRLIRVVDNGCGIPADQVELAFARHATSKLRTAEDLTHIATLGFRGEALASIAAVSHLTMMTRAEAETVGIKLRLIGGEVASRENCGCPAGTSVTVENLFFNTPARRKFLRTEATEAGRINDLISSYALAYPELRFRLVVNGRVRLQTTGTGKLEDALVKVYGLDSAQRMLACKGERDDISVQGYISIPELHRSNRKGIILFVNRRWIQDRSLTYAVGQAYHGLLMKGRHPLAVLDIRLPPDRVDVNIHPTKRQVRFQGSRQVFGTVQRTVRETLREEAPMPTASAEATPIPPFARGNRQRVWHPEPDQTASGQLALEIQRTGDVASLDVLQKPGERLPMLRVIGQAAQTYIIAEGPGGMYLIDQHAAHERILYERMLAERDSNQVASQTLLSPAIVELTPSQATKLESRLNQLEPWGFQIAPFGTNTYRVSAIPADMSENEIPETIAELLDQTEDADKAWDEEALITIVCHSAIRAGQTLSMPEMRDLVRQIEATDIPHSCPHGRPTMIHLSASQLEREFGRR
jgi:DNA mismatch repair protein MutL